MTNMLQASTASITAFLLVLQCSANFAFVPRASTSVSIEDYANQFSSNLKQQITASKGSAENISKAVYELGRNITRDIQELRNSKTDSTPQNVLASLTALESHLSITSKQFEEGFERYNNVTHGEIGSTKSHLAFAEQISTEFSWGGLSKISHTINMDFLNKIADLDTVCKMRESQQQSFDVLLKNIRYATAQSYATLDISFELFKRFDRQNENLSYIRNVRSEILNVYRSAARMIKEQMEKLSREFYTCDSSSSVSDPGSFIILKPFQKYLFTEDQISPGFPSQEDSCTKRCAVVNEMTNPIVCKESTHDEHTYNNNDNLCRVVKKCNRVHCPEQDDKFYGRYELCVKAPHFSNRYQFYHPQGKSSGKQCDGYKQILSGSTRGRKHLTGRSRNKFCGVCDCTCLDNNYYISTEPSYADYDDHKVVVGAQFVLLKNTLYIQVRQAKLLPNGEIDGSSISWKSINESESNRVKIDWEDLRGIDLADNTLPKGRTLIGLKFEKVDDPTAKINFKKHRVALSVYSSQYEFAEGRLSDNHKWHYVEASKKELKLPGDDRPARSPDNQRISTKEDEFVIFITTSSASDGGQSTVPYIDNREVAPRTLTPLSGAGLVYVGQKGSGGYIGLKFTTYDIAPHVNAE